MLKCRVIDLLGTIKEVSVSGMKEGEEYFKRENLTLLSYRKSKFKNSVKPDELLVFTKTVSLLLSSNISLPDAVEICGKSQRNRAVENISKSLLLGLKKGKSLSEMLERGDLLFPAIYKGLIRIGEKSGNIHIVMRELTLYLERVKTLRERVKSAMVYPLFILGITTLFSILFITRLLPEFNKMFTALGGDMEEIFRHRGENLSILMILLITVTLLTFLIIKSGGYSVHKQLLRLPVIGKVIMENETYNIIFSISALIKSSMPVESALTSVEDVSSNLFLKRELSNIKIKLEKGEKLSKCFRESAFPLKVSSFIEVGEKTGDLSTVLSDLSEYYLNESRCKTEAVISLLDPIFTLLTGSLLFTLIILFIIPLLGRMGELL